MTTIDPAPEVLRIARGRVRSANVRFEVADVFSQEPGRGLLLGVTLARADFVDPEELELRLRRLGWDCAILRDGRDWVRGEARPAR